MIGTAADMEAMGRKLWGAPNTAMSTRDELRFGAHGSKSVHLRKLVWSDHEAGEGGGYADLHERAHGTRPADVSIAAVYNYHDAAGAVVYQVVRKQPKKFLQRRPDGAGGWTWNLQGVHRVPYRLPDLLRATRGATVFVCEGEKDCDALRDRLLIATTNAGGAGKWSADFAPHFAGRSVVILPDNDQAGQDHALDVAKKLAGAARSIRILQLPDLPPKGDLSDWLAAGGTAEELERLAATLGDQAPPPRQEAGAEPPPEPKADRHALTILRPANCEVGDPRPYVIKGLIARADHAQIIGPPGSGKSALAPLAAYCIAQGTEFMGRRVKQGRVLYLAAEDGHGMKLRVRALRQRYGDAPDFLLVPDALNLMDQNSGDLERVLRIVREHQPAAVFLDTVARAFPGLRENDSDSMGRVVTVARQIAGFASMPAIISVHHVAKDAGSTPRGHGILSGDLDMVMLIQGERSELRTVTIGKNRNGSSDATFAFNVTSFDFGLDEDEDPITAVLAEPVEARRSEPKREAEAKLSDKAAVMLRELRDLIERQAVLISLGESGLTVRAVSRSLARSRLVDRGWFAEHLLRAASDGKAELQRQGFSAENHTLTSLKRRGLASFNRDHVWLL